MKVLRILLDVGLERNEVLVYERRYVGVFVRLGFQPSTSSSARSRAEVDQQGFLLFLRRGQRRVGVFDPVDGHNEFSLV